VAARSALVNFRKTNIYREADDLERRVWLNLCIAQLRHLRTNSPSVPDETNDPWVFSVWKQAAEPVEKARVLEVFAVLKDSPRFQGLSETQRDALIRDVEG
jgi:hypothetical protein